MSKIKLMTDSASDIPKELEAKYDIRILCFPITLGEKSFYDRDYDYVEYYDMLINSKDFPTHAQITAFEFEEIYKEYYEQGYTDLIYVAIASLGSNTYNNAVMAVDTFFENTPEAKGKYNIHVIDSGNYTGVYGYPLIQSAIKISKGASAEEVIAYMKDWLSCAEVHFGCYTLEFVKRSGRVSTAAAFVGEMLGLRPVIKIKGGVSTTDAKVRGDKAIIPKIVEITADRIIPQTPYCLVYAYDESQEKELAKELTKKLGYPPEMSFRIGGVIAANAGPKLVGAFFKAKD